MMASMAPKESLDRTTHQLLRSFTSEICEQAMRFRLFRSHPSAASTCSLLRLFWIAQQLKFAMVFCLMNGFATDLLGDRSVVLDPMSG